MIVKRKTITIDLSRHEWDTELHDIVLYNDPNTDLGFNVKAVPKAPEAIKITQELLQRIKEK